MFDYIEKLLNDSPIAKAVTRFLRTGLSVALAAGLVYITENLEPLFGEIDLSTETEAVAILVLGSLFAALGKFLREKGIVQSTSI